MCKNVVWTLPNSLSTMWFCSAKCNAKKNQISKIIATSMEERSKRLQHLLKRNEELQELNNSRIDKTRSLPARTAELFGSTIIRRDQIQTDGSKLHALNSRRRSLSAGKIVPNCAAPPMHRRFSSLITTDCNFPQVHNHSVSTEFLTSSNNLNFLGLHRMSRNGSDADVESLSSTTDARHLFAKRVSAASIDSIIFSRTQTASPTNHRHSLQLSDNDRYLSDDGGASSLSTNEAYKKKRFNLASLQYYNAIEPGKYLINYSVVCLETVN